MAKGGRYLNTNKTSGTGKKKGRGWKIALIVLVLLALIIGAVAVAGNGALDSILDKVTRAEFVEKDLSAEDQKYWETFNYDDLG